MSESSPLVVFELLSNKKKKGVIIVCVFADNLEG